MADLDAEFATLMKQIQAGSKEAAEQMHSRFGPYILRAVRQRLHHRLRSKFDSVDFVQDVWASFFTDIPHKNTFERPEDLVAFLTTMARNKVVETVRTRMQRQKYNVNRETPLDNLPQGADRFPAAQQTPSEIVMGREEWELMLDKQPPVHRRILLLLRDGKTSETIAGELGISVRTVNRVLRKVLPGD